MADFNSRDDAIRHIRDLSKSNKYSAISDDLIELGRSNILVVALSYPVGTDKDRFIEPFKDILTGPYQYSTKIINIPKHIIKEFYDDEAIKETAKALCTANEVNMESSDKIKNIAFGTSIRLHNGSHYLAYKAMQEVFKEVLSDNEPLSTKGGNFLKNRNAYIISSIKNDSELELLSTVFGKNFFLVSLHQSLSERKNRLKDLGWNKIVQIDNKESVTGDMGQRLSSVFHKAHYFISLPSIDTSSSKPPEDDDSIKKHCKRFLSVILGHKFSPPTHDEYGNYLAFSAALKSMDVSRQIGAAILMNGDVVSTGANDVQDWGKPYWYSVDEENLKDFRDYVVGVEPNRAMSKIWGKKAYEELKENKVKLTIENHSGNESEEEAISKLIGNFLKKELTEFGRIIHAEMDAIISAARRGVSIKDATIFTTTLPCHNCAKHIAAAGVKKVIYVEPYDKSKLLELNPDTITIDPIDAEKNNKLLLEPFVGFGIQKFRDYFSVSGRGFKGKIDRLNALGTEGGTIDRIKQVVDKETPSTYEAYTTSWEQTSGNKKPRYFSFTYEIIERAQAVLNAQKKQDQK